jgi:hypothetical protein
MAGRRSVHPVFGLYAPTTVVTQGGFKSVFGLWGGGFGASSGVAPVVTARDGSMLAAQHVRRSMRRGR